MVDMRKAPFRVVFMVACVLCAGAVALALGLALGGPLGAALGDGSASSGGEGFRVSGGVVSVDVGSLPNSDCRFVVGLSDVDGAPGGVKTSRVLVDCP